MPTIEEIRSFDAVARLGSMREAAKELLVADSTVSKHVGAIESKAAAMLFTRVKRRFVTTERGQEIADLARQCLEAHGALLAALAPATSR
ncbi:LysR family transcriptional regulator [Promicromonospora sp. Populi]|uniref:LysR family transcriptional regulator n=1 Tax=Promicromonospora sp. Populi TaxID=3239420 RepID=UPI0034E1C91B